MINRQVLSILKQRFTKKNGELKVLKRPPKWLDPLNVERAYTATLYRYTFKMREVIQQVIFPRLPAWIREATGSYPKTTTPRSDDFIDEINQALELINLILEPFEQQAIQAAARYGADIAIFNARQFDKTVNSVLGVDIFVDNAWLEPQLKLFANQNAELIKSLTSNEIERVASAIQRNLQEGSSLEMITDEIEKSFGINRRHAKLIARDQTTKLNGSLTKLRQQEIGVREYKWQTSGDERVRASHRVLDGKYCSWDDPTIYKDSLNGEWKKKSSIGGDPEHTSQAVNCRCVPIPVIEGIFED